jgi:hypothetical protein
MLNQIANIRSPRRIGEHHRFQIGCGEFVTDRQAKEVDHFVGVRADEMGAQSRRAVYHSETFSECIRNLIESLGSQLETLDRRQIGKNGFGEFIDRRRDRSPFVFAEARSNCS